MSATRLRMGAILERAQLPGARNVGAIDRPILFRIAPETTQTGALELLLDRRPLVQNE